MAASARVAAIGTTLPDVAAQLRAAGCVFADDEAALLLSEARTPAELDEMVSRRISGLPLEQVVGWAEFCGIRVGVEPGVFVPRRRSELLVRAAAPLAPADAVVVELCCGTGAVGLALAVALGAGGGGGGRGGDIVLYAADIDPAAVRCARRNVVPVGGWVFEGDLYDPLPPSLRGTVDIVVVNAPYVPTGAIRLMPPEARLHESRVALDGGPDGLDVQRRIAAQTTGWLAPGGHLLVETSVSQAPATMAAMADAGLIARTVRSEDLDGTVVIGSHQGSSSTP